MDYIITTYFTAEKDPQRSNIWSNDDFSIIEKFYNGILKHGLNCLILIDNSSDNFIKKYTTDKIKFLRCDSSGLNVVDIRWKLYSNLLSCRSDITRVFFVDVSDVLILKNPFNFIQPDKIYCGDEDSINMENQWMMDRYFLLNQSTVINKLANYVDKVVLNAGILGGERLVIMEITEKISKLLAISKVASTTVDMCAFNHILYMDYNDKLVHGLPVNTVFKTYDFDNKEAWFCHK
jgi:hypothetical protein